MWDWSFVGELALGVALGIGAGGWFAADALGSALRDAFGHPTLRKLAGGLEQLSEGGPQLGGWDVLGKLLDTGAAARERQARLEELQLQQQGRR